MNHIHSNSPEGTEPNEDVADRRPVQTPLNLGGGGGFPIVRPSRAKPPGVAALHAYWSGQRKGTTSVCVMARNLSPKGPNCWVFSFWIFSDSGSWRRSISVLLEFHNAGLRPGLQL